MDFAALLDEIRDEVLPLTAQGKVADYIPALATVPRERFGMAVVTLDGQVFSTGDARVGFSIQSLSKVYTLTLALNLAGEALWQRVGREPSGSAFNSLVQLESERGIPRNPFINAGAHVLADVILGHSRDPRGLLLDFVRARADNAAITSDAEVARSEQQTGFRNYALAYFLRSFGNLRHDVEQVLAFYFYQCSLSLDCIDLARSLAFVANRGVCPWTGIPVLTPSRAKRISALMLTCGTYDAAGDFAFQVGLPAKSGVGGGIVGIIPNKLAIAVWSPALNEKGNSVAGTAALERFTSKTGMSVF
jgi:glutaminase